MTGMMLSTVSVQQKTSANSLANLSYNIFGFLPAPFIYGAIYDMGEGNNGRLAMGVLMFSSALSIVCLLIVVHGVVKEDLFDFKGQEQEA